MEDRVVDSKFVTNGTIEVRVRIYQSGKVVLDAPRASTKHRSWVVTQLYLQNGLRAVFE